MCGIIGYVGSRECKDLLLDGLKRLEYRGYDSAGIALLEDDGLHYVRAVGNTFTSETDAEVVVHLIERHYEGDLAAAVRAAYDELEGHFSFVVIHKDHPNLLVGARCQTPLVVGVGDGETFLASSIAAFLQETRRVQFIEDDEVVSITPEGAIFHCPDGST